MVNIKNLKKKRSPSEARENAKTTPWTKIKAEYLQGVTPQMLAKKYKLTEKQVSDKAYREKWKDEKAKINEKTRENLQDKIQSLTNNALEVLCEVMNHPDTEDKDKVSAAKAILDISGLKSIKQEIKADVNAEMKAPKWDKEMAKQVMNDIRELVGE